MVANCISFTNWTSVKYTTEVSIGIDWDTPPVANFLDFS